MCSLSRAATVVLGSPQEVERSWRRRSTWFFDASVMLLIAGGRTCWRIISGQCCFEMSEHSNADNTSLLHAQKVIVPSEEKLLICTTDCGVCVANCSCVVRENCIAPSFALYWQTRGSTLSTRAAITLINGKGSTTAVFKTSCRCLPAL